MESKIKTKLFVPVGKKVARGVLDIVLPPNGTASHDMPTENWPDFVYLDEPCCATCGYPFEYSRGPEEVCARCMVDPPVFDGARSALRYQDESSVPILSFKHGGRTRHLERFAVQMARAGRGFWPQADVLVPVPLHFLRLRKRKFNQAALLARVLSEKTGLPCKPEYLWRHKATVSQGSQTAKGRFRNVQGAFSVPDEFKSVIMDKNIVIIDDVYTTGATLEACARTLRRAGAAKIYAITLARVVRDQEIPT